MTKVKSSILILAAAFISSIGAIGAQASEGSTESHFSVPSYERATPDWGFQLTGTTPGMEKVRTKTYPVSLQMDFQPIHFFGGVFGVGPSLNLYPTVPGGLSIKGVNEVDGKAERKKDEMIAAASLGAQTRYQARIFRSQLVVPTVGYAAEALQYRLRGTGKRGHLLMHGPTAGVWLYLNFIDSRSSRHLYANAGVSRTYLIAEYRNMWSGGRDEKVSLQGESYLLGLRVEM